MTRFLIFFSFLLFTATVMAAHCVKDAETIDAALARMDLSADQHSQVLLLKDEGLTLHNSGDHRGAERKLAEGMRILLENVISTAPMEHKMGMGQGMEGGCCGGMDHNMEGGSCSGMAGGSCGMDHSMDGMSGGCCGGNMNTE